MMAERDKPLIHTAWPEFSGLADAEADAEMHWVIGLIEGIRSVRAEMNVPAGAKIGLVLTGASDAVAARLDRNRALIERLARLKTSGIADAAPDGSVTMVLDDCSANLPLAGHIDVAAEKARLTKALGKAEKEAGGIEKKLSNQGFLAKAPEEVVEEQRDRLSAAQSEAARLNAALEKLAAM